MVTTRLQISYYENAYVTPLEWLIMHRLVRKVDLSIPETRPVTPSSMSVYTGAQSSNGLDTGMVVLGPEEVIEDSKTRR